MTATDLASPASDPGPPTSSATYGGDDGGRPTTIRFDGAGKNFSDRWIVRQLDVDVPSGTILGMVGPSGCGKTTTVRLMTGVYRPDEGAVTVLGRDPARQQTSQRTAIGYLPQAPVLFDDLSMWENLNFHASLNGVPWRRRERLDEVLALVELTGEERKLVRESSGGMRRRLALAATLVHDPALLILDEPTAGIDPLLRRQIWEHLRQLRDDDHTVVVTTQYVDEAANCDIVVVLDEGRVVAVGSPEDLRRKAFGGEVYTITLAATIDDRVLSLVREGGGARVDVVDASVLRVVVDDGTADLPVLVGRLEEQGVEIAESAEVPVDWDEAFIALVGPREAS